MPRARRGVASGLDASIAPASANASRQAWRSAFFGFNRSPERPSGRTVMVHVRVPGICVQRHGPVEPFAEDPVAERAGCGEKRGRVSVPRHRQHERQAQRRRNPPPSVRLRERSPVVRELAYLRPATQRQAVAVLEVDRAVAGDVVEMGLQMPAIARPARHLDHDLRRAGGDACQPRAGRGR